MGARASWGGRPEVGPSGPRTPLGGRLAAGASWGRPRAALGAASRRLVASRRDATGCPEKWATPPAILPLSSRACRCCPQVTGARLAISPHSGSPPLPLAAVAGSLCEACACACHPTACRCSSGIFVPLGTGKPCLGKIVMVGLCGSFSVLSAHAL